MTKLLQDIVKEPEELSRSLAHTLGPGRAALDAAAAVLRGAEAIVITGIGSSWHAGMALQSLFLAEGRPALLLDASELLHFTRIPANAAIVVLSRSGKSVEVVNLMPLARRSGAKVIAVTNTPDSPLAEAADVTLRLETAFDHNVSVTMYSALALVGGLLVLASQSRLAPSLADTLAASLAAARDALDGWREQIGASDWFTRDAPTYFLARGASLASCHEARLLWEEAAKAPASALTTGGFRHGPQEIIEPGLRVGLWVDGERLREADLVLAADLRCLGAKVMLIGQDVAPDAADLVFRLPAIPAEWQFLIDIVPVQLASEHLARLRGANCDAFRICSYIVETEGGLGAAREGRQ